MNAKAEGPHRRIAWDSITARCELILAQAKRAKTPKELADVGAAVAEVAEVASSDQLDTLETAMGVASDKINAYKSGRVVPLRGPR